MCEYCTNGKINEYGEETFRDFGCLRRSGPDFASTPYMFKTNNMYFMRIASFEPFRVKACCMCGRPLE